MQEENTNSGGKQEKWLSLNTTKILTIPLILIIPASLGSQVYQKLYIYIYIYLVKVIPETRRVHCKINIILTNIVY
jgi:hypothetical protein